MGVQREGYVVPTSRDGKPLIFPNNLKNGIVIDLRVEFVAICAIPDKPYGGVIDITYIPNNFLIDWDVLQEWLLKQKMERLTAEAFLEKVHDYFVYHVQPDQARFTMKIRSALHMPVTLIQTYNSLEGLLDAIYGDEEDNGSIQ